MLFKNWLVLNSELVTCFLLILFFEIFVTLFSKLWAYYLRKDNSEK